MTSTNPDVTMKAEGSMEAKSNSSQGPTSQHKGSTQNEAGHASDAALDLFILQHKTVENTGLRRQINKVMDKRHRLLEPPVDARIYLYCDDLCIREKPSESQSRKKMMGNNLQL